MTVGPMTCEACGGVLPTHNAWCDVLRPRLDPAPAAPSAPCPVCEAAHLMCLTNDGVPSASDFIKAAIIAERRAKESAEAERDKLRAGVRSFFVATKSGSDVTAEWRGPRLDGGVSWAVMWRSRRLSRQGKWDYEPLPSSRTDEWIDNHAWPSLDAAIQAALRAAGGG